MRRVAEFGRAFGNVEFWLLLATAFAGAFGVGWWVGVPLCMAGLSISSLPKYMRLWPKAREVGGESTWWGTVGLSLLVSLAASVATYGAGAAARLLFGG